MSNIITSQKNSIIYIEHCKVCMASNQLCFNKSQNGEIKYYAIPYGNLAVLILGPGTSITQQAAKTIAKEKMIVAFSSGHLGNLYLAAQSEYRKPEFMQKWYAMWMKETSRLDGAKQMFKKRFDNNLIFWERLNNKLCKEKRFFNIDKLKNLNSKIYEKVMLSKNTQELLGFEGNYVKEIYKILAEDFDLKFNRDYSSNMDVNGFLNKANYLSYGAATSVLWTLGISSSLSLFHGKTRKGGLVFDLADTIKDGITLPLSFLCYYQKSSIGDLRKLILQVFEDFNVLSNMFLTVREVLERFDPNLHDEFFDDLNYNFEEDDSI